MKVILYMAITANGYIAKKNDDTSWISEVEWNSYSASVRKAGNLVIGHRTYDILTKQPEFSEFANVKIAIVSNKDFKTLSSNHVIVKTAKAALDMFKKYEEIIIAGGGILNATFMKEDLVDEIYLDIEPIVFGHGISLFAPEDFEYHLELLETKKISENTIQLYYKVVK